jgi:hypothetical protein
MAMHHIHVMVITLKPSKAVMAKWKYSFQEIAAVVLNRLLLRKDILLMFFLLFRDYKI